MLKLGMRYKSDVEIVATSAAKIRSGHWILKLGRAVKSDAKIGGQIFKSNVKFIFFLNLVRS